MANVNEVMQQARKIRLELEAFLRLSTYNEYDDLSGLDINWNDPEELFIVDELRTITEQFGDAVRNLKYIDLPIGPSGKLHKNSEGYYEFNGNIYHSGNGIEFLCMDPYEERNKWVCSRVEYNGDDYYIVGYKEINMKGLTVRIRN